MITNRPRGRRGNHHNQLDENISLIGSRSQNQNRILGEKELKEKARNYVPGHLKWDPYLQSLHPPVYNWV